VTQSNYHSFVLRIWRVLRHGRLCLRIILENIQSGEKSGFPSLEKLNDYLIEKTAVENQTSTLNQDRFPPEQ
jgi:hypothetical protein